MVSAYILIQTEVGKAAQVTQQVSGIDGVVAVDPVTGPYDVVARAEADDLDGLAKGDRDADAGARRHHAHAHLSGYPVVTRGLSRPHDDHRRSGATPRSPTWTAAGSGRAGTSRSTPTTTRSTCSSARCGSSTTTGSCRARSGRCTRTRTSRVSPTWSRARSDTKTTSAGAPGPLPAGSVQRMTLGRGAWHSEQNASETEPMRFIQMWIMPDERGLEPGVEQKVFTERGSDRPAPGGDQRRRRRGRARAPGRARVRLSACTPAWRSSHELAAGRGVYLYVIEGDADVVGERMTTGDAAEIWDEPSLVTRANETTELIVVDVALSEH